MEIRTPARPQVERSSVDEQQAPAKAETPLLPKQDAKIGDGGINAAEQAKVTDVILKPTPGTLVDTVLQGATAKTQTPGAEGSSATGLQELGALRELMGPPPKKDAVIPATGFELRPAIEREGFAETLSPETTAVFTELAKNDMSALTTEPQMRALQKDLESPDPAVRTAANQKLGELRALFKKCDALVEKYFTRATELTPQQLLAKQPTHLAAAAQKELPKLLEALRATFKAIDAQAKKGGDISDVVLPDAVLVQAEAAFAPLLASCSATEQAIAKVKKDPAKFKALQDALRVRRETGKLDGVDPEIAKIVRDVSPFAEGEGLRARVADTPNGTSVDFNDIIATGDIEALIQWVMMQLAESAEDELRDIMKDMKKSIDAKKIQREKVAAMKKSKAELDTSMRVEFNELKGNGVLHTSTTFEDYRAWRPVEQSDAGTSRLRKITAEDVPALLRNGPPSNAMTTDGPSAQVTVSVGKLAAADATAYAKLYGISANDVQYLYTYYEWARDRKDGTVGKSPHTSFKSFLEGVTGGPCDSARLKPTGGDATKAKANEAAIKTFLAALPAVTKSVAEADKKAGLQVIDLSFLAGPPTDPDLLTYTVREGGNTRTVNGTLHPTSDAIKNMSDAELNAVYDAVRAKLVGTTLPTSLDGFRDLLKEYIKLGCVGGDTTAVEKLNAVFDKAEGEFGTLLKGIFCQVRERTLTKFSTALHAGDAETLKGLGLNAQAINCWFAKMIYCEGFQSMLPLGGEVAQDWAAKAKGKESQWWPQLTIGEDSTKAAAALDAEYTAAVQAKTTREKERADEKAAKAREEAERAKRDAGAVPPRSFLDQFTEQWTNQRDVDAAHAEARRLEGEKAAKAADDREDDAAGISLGSDDGAGSWRMGSAATLEAAIEAEEGNLDTMGDQTELQQTRLQMYMDRRAKAFETLSNVLKKFAQTSEAIIGNMK